MSLSKTQQRFFDLIDSTDLGYILDPIFDRDKRELKTKGLGKYMAVFSHGEQIMIRFFVNVWLGREFFKFELIEAARTLDSSNREVIATWLDNPFYP